MSKSDAPNRTRPTVFVLWGTHFDEVVAVLAVISLRQAGVRIKVVGLSGPWAKGAHGLGLQADLTLDEALATADQAIGVVIPCTMHCFQGMRVDPRVQVLLARVEQNGFTFGYHLHCVYMTLFLRKQKGFLSVNANRQDF